MGLPDIYLNLWHFLRTILIEIAYLVFCLAYLVFCLAYLVFCLAYLVFCLAYLVFCLAYLVFYLAYLVFGGLFGVHYIFFGVIGICGIGMLYLLHLEFGMVHLIFSSQNNAQICVGVASQLVRWKGHQTDGRKQTSSGRKTANKYSHLIDIQSYSAKI